MKNTTRTSQTPTLLGELLVRRGVVARENMEQALSLQQVTGQPLGATLISQGWLCEHGLAQALRRQRHLRFAVGFVTAISLPVIPTLTVADTAPTDVAASLTATRRVGNLVPLSDAEMSDINARGSLFMGDFRDDDSIPWVKTTAPGNLRGYSLSDVVPAPASVPSAWQQNAATGSLSQIRIHTKILSDNRPPLPVPRSLH